MKNKFEFLVGLFIVFSFFFSIILLIFFSSSVGFLDFHKKYKLKAVFINVGNLKVNSKVTLCGVKIGHVDKIILVKNKLNEYYAEVDMLIDFQFKFIPRDSVANIYMVNLLGDNYIQIDLGNDELFFNDGDTIFLTNQALIIEDLIGKFAFSK